MAGALIVLGLWGCSDDAPVAPPGVVAIYDAPELTVLTPYPSDRYTVADDTPTGLRVDIGPGKTTDLIVRPGSEETVAELSARDGFSTTGGLVVTFSGPVDIAGVATSADPELDPGVEPKDATAFADPTTSPLLLVDVDPDSPEFGTARGLIVRWWETPADDYYLEAEYTLVAQPAEPLRPRTRYMFAVTDQLRARDGGAVHRSPLMDSLLTGSDPYANKVATSLAVLQSELGVNVARLSLASTFTTGTVHAELAALAAAARQAEPPALVEPWSVETPLAEDGRIRFRARYASPEYRAEDGRFVVEGGQPTVQVDTDLEVFMAVSNATSSAPRPVVIYAHGLGGDKDGSWGTASRLADLNAAVFAIDSPHHGSRLGEGQSDTTAVFNFFGIDAADSSFVIGRARDNFRQMAADQLELVRLIATLGDLDILPEGAPDGVPDLDVSRILYIGHSFGAVQGPSIFALAPEVEHAVWNVGGAGLMTLLRDSGTFSLLVNALKPQGTTDGAVARFFAVAQAIVDPGDPLNYAHYGTVEALSGVENWKPRDVLLQEVIADNIVPNSTTRALARAARLRQIDAIQPISGVPQVDSPLHDGLGEAVGAISQFDRMEGDKKASHGELIFSPEGRAQYVEFFRSALEDGDATVVAPY